ncbi:MAG: hypothetical protein PHE27_03830 [Alphaproteobacteria bacterium]|nr:hypothetical protein [Alphaproteobacteria bacterium]
MTDQSSLKDFLPDDSDKLGFFSPYIDNIVNRWNWIGPRMFADEGRRLAGVQACIVGQILAAMKETRSFWIPISGVHSERGGYDNKSAFHILKTEKDIAISPDGKAVSLTMPLLFKIAAKAAKGSKMETPVPYRDVERPGYAKPKTIELGAK